MSSKHCRSIQCPSVTALLFILCLALSRSFGTLVHEINKGSLDKFLKGKFFSLTYVDSTSCTRCKNMYPYFVAAAQAFPKDPEIFFSRTHDIELIKAWGIEELPALVYHREGSSNHAIFNVDVTVDDIIEEIGRILFGDFTALVKTYNIHLNKDNYDEMVITSKQATMILIYNKDSADIYELFEKVAYAFRKDDAILFASIDVDYHEGIRNDRFLTRDVPAVMWLPAMDKKTPLRFGGMLTRHLIGVFINEQTGLHRNVDGGLNPEAGRIPGIDYLLNEYADIIHELNVDNLLLLADEIHKHRDRVEPHMVDMLDYYVFVMKHLATEQRLTALDELLRDLETRLIEDEELSTKSVEMLKRHMNIVSFLIQLVKKVKNGEWKSTRESELGEEGNIVTFDPHAHVHTEL